MEHNVAEVSAREPKPGVRLSAVIPVCDEADNIGPMLAELTRAMESRSVDFEVVVVNDGSRDATAEIVASIAQRDTRIRLVRHPCNEGYGAALRTGLASTRNDLIFLTDGDRQFDPAEIDRLLDRIPDADMVVGYRDPRRDPFIRRMNGRAWSWLVRVVFGVPTRDVDCAFKLMRRPVIESLQAEIFSRGATFSAELLVRAQRAGFRIRQVSLSGHRPRPAGRPSGARLSVIRLAFLELLQLRIALWREDRHQAPDPARRTT
jgi:glycosyltransferase involved in cell wall biosynthesis